MLEPNIMAIRLSKQPAIASTMTLALLLIGCGKSPPTEQHRERVFVPHKPDPFGNPVVVFGDRENLEAVKECRVVHAVRLKQPNWEEQDRTKIEAVGISSRLSDSLSKDLTLAVTEKSSYVNGFKGCAPDFGIRTSHETKAGKVEIYYCLGCDILHVYRDGQYAGSGNFDWGRERLLKVFKQVFVNDQDIQKLKME